MNDRQQSFELFVVGEVITKERKKRIQGWTEEEEEEERKREREGERK